jgi:predicted RNA-binding protein YlxR (DUF448 family)
MHAIRHKAADPDGHAAVRTCIVSRADRDPSDLIRFVLGPNDTVTPDIANKLPGRGAWVTATRAAVEQAATKGGFKRAFRKQVTVAPDLAEIVDQLLEKRTVQALSLAKKAGMAISGFSKVDALIASGGASVLIHACDASDGGASRLTRKFQAINRERDCEAVVVEILTIAQLSLAMGRANVVHAALSPGRATQGFVSAANCLTRYRHPQTASEGQVEDEATHFRAVRTVNEHDVGPETEEV